jgi:acyl-CoA synthetase (AMP-forming)/AMP-acid ligase II
LTAAALSPERVLAERRRHLPADDGIAEDVCDKHPREKLAMAHEDPDGTVPEVSWGELQDTSNHPGNALRVAEAPAVASPDGRRGTLVQAFAVLAPGRARCDDVVRDMQGHVRDPLSAYAYPPKVEFVDELPKTLTGKIRRSELREREHDG